MALFKRKQAQKLSYDKETQIPVMRSSICTGERSFGFKDKETGRVSEYCAIKTDEELKAVLDKFGIAQEDLKIEW